MEEEIDWKNDLPPEAYVTRGNILWCNGFGFQYARGGTDTECAIADIPGIYAPLIRRNLEMIKSDSNCKSVILNHLIGNEYVAVHWRDTNRIFDVLNVLLQMGIKFSLFAKNKPSVYLEDYPLNREKIDKIMMREIDNVIMWRGYNKVKSVFGSRIFDPWNWQTKEGKDYCAKITSDVNFSLTDAEKRNYTKWPIMMNMDVNTLLDLPLSGPVISSDPVEPSASSDPVEPSVSSDPVEPSTPSEENNSSKKRKSIDETICVVCLEAVADTMVLPCEHCVVCKNCSVALRSTSNAHTCVYCRAVIEHILE